MTNNIKSPLVESSEIENAKKVLLQARLEKKELAEKTKQAKELIKKEKIELIKKELATIKKASTWIKAILKKNSLTIHDSKNTSQVIANYWLQLHIIDSKDDNIKNGTSYRFSIKDGAKSSKIVMKKTGLKTGDKHTQVSVSSLENKIISELLNTEAKKEFLQEFEYNVVNDTLAIN